MKKLIAFLFFISGNYIYGQAIDSLNQSLTYFELIKEYKILDQKYDNAALITYGKTDCGLNLQLFIISGNGIFQPQSLHELGKVILLWSKMSCLLLPTFELQSIWFLLVQ